MILRRLFERKPDPGQALYEAIVAAARQPRFYADMAVPDTVDGRFDMIALHMFLVLDRLNDGALETTRQTLTDVFFRDMDRSLREMGVGDLSVGKKVRKMAEAFFGRLLAYKKAASESQEALASALARNIYVDSGSEHATALAKWVLAAQASLATQSANAIVEAKVKFPS
jgi:cytochrome b pre-mRNA-processing protein 3